MASTSLQVYRNRPVDDGSGWQLCGKNLNNFDATSFTTVVVCLSGVSGGATWRSAGNKLIEPGESIRLDATCPAGGLLLSSGGFAALEPEIYAYSNNRSFQEPNVWTSTFLNPTDDDGVIDLTINCLELWP